MGDIGKRVRLIGLILFLLFGPVHTASAQQLCADNTYVPNADPSTIFISESAISYAYSNCPGPGLRLSAPIRLKVGQSLFFWFRLQGDQAYLASPESRYPFMLNFFRYNGSDFVDEGSLGMARLDRAAMLAEAQGSGGAFDWRTGAEKWKFDIPGTYKVFVTQAGHDIPCYTSTVFSPCRLTVEVIE
jgi:hypothetical protein